ncbi:MAG: SprT family zinc-dependent metalloprotease [Proteobacteria bacterium]|nr:SprT family zinc-dependent metalloprotease [Pseudomonadota bacterium]
MGSVTRTVIDEIAVEVRRNARRKTRIGLVFDPAGHLILDVPFQATAADIKSAVVEHKRWIHHRLRVLKDEMRDQPISSVVEDGALIGFLGESLRLAVTDGSGRAKIERVGNRLNIRLPEGRDLAALVRRWYRTQAADVFSGLLVRSAQLPWVDGVPAWRQQFMKSQWGSCSVKGRISLNTHLIQTPVRLIEYVVLHELCHLKHMNHSPRFYGLLQKHMPDWDMRRRELRKYIPVLLRG